MKKIDINVNNARILGYSVLLADENLPSLTATIGLYSGENKISEFGLSTNTWCDQHFDLPANMVPAIVKISKELEVILTNSCISSLRFLEGKQDA